MTAHNYYNVDLGVFPTSIKLCFNQAGVDKILEDHGINLKINAFEYGAAETHYMTCKGHGIVLLMFDLDSYGDDRPYINGLIAHEAYHVACRVFQNIGESRKKVGEEVIAYTVEHIFKLVSVALETELEKRSARKKCRSVPKQTRQRTRRTVV